jgi:N-acetylmuramoyl-L-alanine amidase
MKNKALKRLICGLWALLVSFSLFSFKLVPLAKKDTAINNGYKLKTVIIDPGHGGNPVYASHSTHSHFSHGASGSYSTERGVTLALAFKLQTAIEKEMNGVKAVLTRTTEDDVAFERRAEIANENKGDLFISLHCNAMPDRIVRERVGTKHHKPVYKSTRVADHSGRGVLVIVYGFHRTKEEENAIKQNMLGEEEDAEIAQVDPNDPVTAILLNEYKRKFRQNSINFANLINNEFVNVDGRPSDGVIEKGIYVLCNSAMPSVLVETGFIDNPQDEDYLNSEKGQDEIIDSIVRALKKYKDEVEQVASN